MSQSDLILVPRALIQQIAAYLVQQRYIDVVELLDGLKRCPPMPPPPPPAPAAPATEGESGASVP